MNFYGLDELKISLDINIIISCSGLHIIALTHTRICQGLEVREVNDEWFSHSIFRLLVLIVDHKMDTQKINLSTPCARPNVCGRRVGIFSPCRFVSGDQIKP